MGAAWRMMGGLIHLLPTLDDGAPRPPAAWLDQLEDTLVLHLLYNQPNTWRGGPAATPPRRLALAEAYMRAHLATPMTLKTSPATPAPATRLTRLFQEHRDTTPMNALRALRLDAARQRLLDGACANVTEAALAVGFGHLGRFSDYKERFGELPRQTLRLAQ